MRLSAGQGFAEIIKDRQKATTAGNMETFCSTEYRQPEVRVLHTYVGNVVRVVVGHRQVVAKTKLAPHTCSCS